MRGYARRLFSSQSLAIIYLKVFLTIIASLVVLWVCASLISLFFRHGIEEAARDFAAEVHSKEYEAFPHKHLFTFGETGRRQYQSWKNQLQSEYSLSIEQGPGSGHAYFQFENGAKAAVVVDVDYLPPRFRILSVSH